MSLATTANQHLIMTGDKERFRTLLQSRLTECGWRDQIKLMCRQIVKEKADSNITVEMLVNEVTPKARAIVPDTVKKELLHKIKKQLLENEKLDVD
uniref:Enhancer of yellow 2 transcription factor n=1 Tax=Xenopsylla cheopis TaxID=163159 RepID=A0A6M2DNH0_XENCH